MLFIAEEAAEKLFDKFIDLGMLAYLIGAECSSEAIIGHFIVETGFDLFDKVLNALFLFHLWRDLWFLCSLILTTIATSSVC